MRFLIYREVLIRMLVLSVLIASCRKDNEAENRSPVLLPDTGQTTGYTLTQGEDSDFSINPPSYTDNGDGTITDNVTGLMWQKTDGGEMTFSDASDFCKSLNTGGYTDWRLPTGFELVGINNYDKVNPALNIDYFTKTVAEYWWTSEMRADAASYIWVVNAGGGIGAHPSDETISAGGTKRFHVRAVRNIKMPVAISSRFTDNNNGTITDNLTGLIWQKIASPDLMTWEEALIYASELSLGSKDDWRLPNVKEIQSLNDPQLTKPSFNKNFFPDCLSGNYWSSTTQVNAPAKAWDINIDYGIVSYNDKTLKEHVLCVR
jgi:hypothetical protein